MYSHWAHLRFSNFGLIFTRISTSGTCPALPTIAEGAATASLLSLRMKLSFRSRLSTEVCSSAFNVFTAHNIDISRLQYLILFRILPHLVSCERLRRHSSAAGAKLNCEFTRAGHAAVVHVSIRYSYEVCMYIHKKVLPPERDSNNFFV